MAKTPHNMFLTFLLFALTSFLLSSGVECSHDHHVRPHKARLFVFGDSYADTGNFNRSFGGSWKIPYGITFPGEPSGRYSDGRVLTDFIAKFLKLKTPVPYTMRKLTPHRAIDGLNFAFGGTGVLNTTATIKLGLPNMTTQIDFFQNMLAGKDIIHIYGSLADSVAYVSDVGNDYSTYLSTGGTLQGLPTFITKVVNQLSLNLQRIMELGITKILVTGLQPIGCSPQITAIKSFSECNSTFNSAVQFHNTLLTQAVAKLNKQSHTNTPIHILDLYDAFFTAFNKKNTHTGAVRFKTPLTPCCFGINSSSFCGDVDANGKKLYTLCEDRASAFYWDSNHPTQEGWKILYPILKTTIKQVV